MSAFADLPEPLRVSGPDAVAWDDEADLVIAGFGGAGAAAGIEAAERGLSVLALDRFFGGGTTLASGGIVYAGGGTRIQQAAGEQDSVENMLAYLRTETQGVVSEATLRRFCEESPGLIAWLEAHGMQFRPSVWKGKIAWPNTDYFLYHSDNSLLAACKAVAHPAARGHRAVGRDPASPLRLGAAVYAPLERAALAAGVRLQRLTEVRRLVMDGEGRVIGAEVMRFPPDGEATRRYAALLDRAGRLQRFLPPIVPGARLLQALARRLQRRAAALEGTAREVRRVRARRGLLLATGGFIMDRTAVARVAPGFSGALPLGTAGDDGSGIRLGLGAGAAAAQLDRISAWRFIKPPLAPAHGIVVNTAGRRFCNELAYGATLGDAIAAEGGRAWVILDAALYLRAWGQLGPRRLTPFYRAMALLNFTANATWGVTLRHLARRLGIDPAALAETVTAYNRAAAGEIADPFGKEAEDLAPLRSTPWVAIDIAIANRLLPCPTLTLGGLVVDEASGQVKRPDGSAIPGLFAAGRAAVGICSNLYVSGLSIADALFSGRRAAAHIAGEAPPATPPHSALTGAAPVA
jgi:3-oxo-5alpha-steroid 4-dehydrogenase